MALSLRVSREIPLPPEISLITPRTAARYNALMQRMSLLGTSDSPLVGIMSSYIVRQGMAETVSRAPYLERLLHYRSYAGAPEPVRVRPQTPSFETPVQVRAYLDSGDAEATRSGASVSGAAANSAGTTASSAAEDPRVLLSARRADCLRIIEGANKNAQPRRVQPRRIMD